MLRSIVAVVVGVIVGGAMVALLEWAGHQVFPLPAGLDVANTDAIAAYWQQTPGALWFVLLAWFFGTLDGAMLAAWLAPSHPWRHAVLVAAILALAALATLLLLPHPLWFVLSAPAVYLAACLLGGKVGGMLHDRRRAGISR